MSSSAARDDRGGASRPPSGILTPSSDGSLSYAGHSNSAAAASPTTARPKRRSDPAMDRLLKPSITVKPHPHALHVPPKTLSPLFLLRRQDLPLGCLDFASTTAESAYTRLVESRIKILDLETRLGAPSSVLIARHDATRTVYAIERAQGADGAAGSGLYAMCRLGAWVGLERLAARHATAVCAERVFPPAATEEALLPESRLPPQPHLNSHQRKKREAIEAIQSLVRKKPKAEPLARGMPDNMIPDLRRSEDEASMPESLIRHIKRDEDEAPMPEILIRHIKRDEDEAPMPEILIRHIKRDEDEAPMPEIMIPHIKRDEDEAPMPEILIRHIKRDEDEAPMPEILIRHIKKDEDEAPMPEIMIPHIKGTEVEVPMPEIMIPHIKGTEVEEKMPEIKIPCVKLPPEKTPTAEPMTARARTPTGETKRDSSAMDEPSALPSSQIHARSIDDGPQDVATNIFENIRAHYFEALYKSLGSLAYFAKGPLSRARSAFHLDLEANLDMADLIEFLKSLVLTTVQIDKKYRDTAPVIIAQLSASLESSDEGRSKGRKAKKMKLGKNGLYPDEDDRIRKWWHANQPELDGEQPTFTATQIKSHLSLLRTRETQLQMILIMEIMALEPLKAAEDGTDGGLPPLPGASRSQARRSPAAAPTKKRNKHNLPVLIDVHADRLTIWQSTATDEQQLAEDSQAHRHGLNGSQVQKASSEPLKDFCTDVILPFFSARIPELCDAINRKLGGPVIIPAGGSNFQKRSASKKEQKPGSATKRPAAPRPPKTLQRALSTDQQSRRSVSRGPSNMIALMRSASSTSLPRIRREGGESAPLRRLPKMEDGDKSQRRPALVRSGSSGVATSQNASRAGRQALVDAQVKDAIAALRKPNREVVGQAMEEVDQQRAIAAAKARKMQRSSIVKATPANNRFKDVFAHGEGIPDTPVHGHHTDEFIPPSSIGPFVPSTGQRNGFRNPMDLNTPRAMDIVGSTPTKRATASFLHRADEEPRVPPSPLARASLQAAAARPLSGNPNTNNRLQPPRTAQGTENQHYSGDHVFATPAKKQKHQQVSASPVGQPQLHGQGGEPKISIFTRLGWDDDYDIE